MTPEQRRRLEELERELGGGGAAPEQAAPAGMQPPAEPQTPEDIELEELRARHQERLARTQPPPGAEPASAAGTARHIAGGAAQAGFDVLDIPHTVAQGRDAVASAMPDIVNRTARSAFPVMANMLDVAGQKPASEMPGLAQAKAVLAKEVPGVPDWADNARTGVEWGAGALGKGGALKHGVGALAKAVTPDVLIGAGAGSGQAFGEYMGGEDGSSAGEIGGAIVGGTAAIIQAMKSGRVDGLSKAQVRMLRTLEDTFDNKDEAIAALRKAEETGELGTLADITRDQTVADVQGHAARNASARPKLARAMQARADQIYDDTMAPLRGGDARRAPWAAEQAKEADVRANAREAASRRAALEAEEATAQEGLVAARQAADAEALAAREAADAAAAQTGQVRAELKPAGRPDEYSKQAAGAVQGAADDFATNVRKPAYAEFEAGDVDVVDIKEGVTDFMAGRSALEQQKLLRDYPQEFAAFEELDEFATPQDVQGVISDIKGAISEKVTGGKNGRAEKWMGELADDLDNRLTKANPKYRAANAAMTEEYKRFKTGDMARARKGEPEVMLQNIGLSGDQGAVTARLVEDAAVPGLKDTVTKYVMAKAARTQTLTDDFLIKYEAVLDNLPDSVRGDIVRIMDAEDRMAEAQKLADQAFAGAERVAKTTERQSGTLKKAREAAQGKVSRQADTVEKYLESDMRAQFAKDPRGTVATLINKKDGTVELKELMDTIKELDQVKSFKAQVKDTLDDSLFSGGEGVTSRANAYRDFQKMRDKLVESDILTQAEADKMGKALERTKTKQLHTASRAYDITDGADELDNLLASGGAAAVLGPLPGAYSLMLGNAARRGFRNALRRKSTEANLKALENYLANPKKYLKELDALKLGDEKEASQALTKLIFGSNLATELGED